MTLPRISDDPIQIRSACKDIYDEFVEDKKIFPYMYNLFGFALVYGLIKSKRSDKNFADDIFRINIIQDEDVKDIVNMVFNLLYEGGDRDPIIQEMLRIADGGLLALKEIYDKNGDLRLGNIFAESEDIWKEKIKELKNINLGQAAD